MIYCPCVLYYNIQLTKLGNFPAVCLPVPKTVTESQSGRVTEHLAKPLDLVKLLLLSINA